MVRAPSSRERSKNSRTVFSLRNAIAPFSNSTSARPLSVADHVALTDWQVRLGCFPLCLLIRERITVGFSSKAHIALDETEANDTGVTGVRGGRMDAHQEDEKRER